jgi:hypothetical protein
MSRHNNSPYSAVPLPISQQWPAINYRFITEIQAATLNSPAIRAQKLKEYWERAGLPLTEYRAYFKGPNRLLARHGFDIGFQFGRPFVGSCSYTLNDLQTQLPKYFNSAAISVLKPLPPVVKLLAIVACSEHKTDFFPLKGTISQIVKKLRNFCEQAELDCPLISAMLAKNRTFQRALLEYQNLLALCGLYFFTIPPETKDGTVALLDNLSRIVHVIGDKSTLADIAVGYFSSVQTNASEYLSSVTATEMAWLTDTVDPLTVASFLEKAKAYCHSIPKGIEVINYWIAGPGHSPYGYSLFNPNGRGGYTKAIPAQVVSPRVPINKQAENALPSKDFFSACRFYVPCNNNETLAISAADCWETFNGMRAAYGHLVKDLNCPISQPWGKQMRAASIQKKAEGN